MYIYIYTYISVIVPTSCVCECEFCVHEASHCRSMPHTTPVQISHDIYIYIYIYIYINIHTCIPTHTYMHSIYARTEDLSLIRRTRYQLRHTSFSMCLTLDGDESLLVYIAVNFSTKSPIFLHLFAFFCTGQFHISKFIVFFTFTPKNL